MAQHMLTVPCRLQRLVLGCSWYKLAGVCCCPGQQHVTTGLCQLSSHSVSTLSSVCREQARTVLAEGKASYLEHASCLRHALGRLSLERKSYKGPEDDDADMQQVEMLLQAYFIHMDNTYNRLDTMNEYISDTEVLLLHCVGRNAMRLTLAVISVAVAML